MTSNDDPGASGRPTHGTRFVFTEHSLARLHERQVQNDWVIDVLSEPDEVSHQPPRWLYCRALPAWNNKKLCVICVEANGEMEVVTAFFNRS